MIFFVVVLVFLGTKIQLDVSYFVVEYRHNENLIEHPICEV